ncbi:hypothetical protein [Actinomadura atramentaria]|uniref:hypothetical protein n=1 Tax=Actinomadura atramentaria TaxID=1990 RepID=UPI000367F6EC|nr:hypothetical protein [Actinomadura atramentaria]
MWVSTEHTLVVPRFNLPFRVVDARHPRDCPQRGHRAPVWTDDGDYACHVQNVLDMHGTDDFYRRGEQPPFAWSQLVRPGKHPVAAWWDEHTYRFSLRLLDVGDDIDEDSYT